MQQMRKDDLLMLNEVKRNWKDFPEDMSLQEKFKRLVHASKKNWCVIYQDQQMANTIMGLGSVYKEESEEKFEAYKHLTGLLLRTQEYMREMFGMDEDELKERSDNLAKFHDPKDPEKQLLPLNWNDLWIKPIVFEEEKKENDPQVKEKLDPKVLRNIQMGIVKMFREGEIPKEKYNISDKFLDNWEQKLDEERVDDNE